MGLLQQIKLGRDMLGCRSQCAFRPMFDQVRSRYAKFGDITFDFIIGLQTYVYMYFMLSQVTLC
jgi:hypothetical protein